MPIHYHKYYLLDYQQSVQNLNSYTYGSLIEIYQKNFHTSYLFKNEMSIHSSKQHCILFYVVHSYLLL